MSSDHDFSDDDDVFLMGLNTGAGPGVGEKTPNGVNQTQSSIALADDGVKNRLFQADGEIAILRAQLNHVQSQKLEEILRIQKSHEESKSDMEDQVKQLRFMVQKLEDEKKFLDNQIKSGFNNKRRKVGDGSGDSGVSQDTPKREIVPHTQRVIKVSNDSSLLTDYLYKISINGSTRATLSFLNKIYIDNTVKIRGYEFVEKSPLSGLILEYLIIKKDLRLDELVKEFSLVLIELVEWLVNNKMIASVPFLLSLINGALNFRTSAVVKDLIMVLSTKLVKIIYKYFNLLNLNSDEEDFVNYYNVPIQQMIMEKFILLCCMDILENTIHIATTFFDNDFLNILIDRTNLWDLINKFLPNNTERFQNIGQINIIFNIIEIITSLIHKENWTIINNQLFTYLVKILLIEIPIKDEFQFYGLNRIIGNNDDFNNIELIIPKTKNLLNKSLISIPNPIDRHQEDQQPDHEYKVKLNHEVHLLTLRNNITKVIDSYLITSLNIDILKLRDIVKSIVRVVNFEQNFIHRSPRSQLINFRVEMVSNLIRILSYLFLEGKNLNELIYPETLSELLIVLLRISFSSDSLSLPGYKLLKQLRIQNYTQPVFNGSSESRAHELSHFNSNGFNNQNDYGQTLAEIESEYGNGLEFPYENSTIELGRELLSKFINHEEADNLYFNMNGGDKFDEMDIVDEIM